MHAWQVAVLVLVAVGASCGGGGASARTGSARPRSSDPLVGAWWGRLEQAPQDAPCPLEIEFFDDGTAEANYLSDDSPAAVCSFELVRAVRGTSAAGAVVRLAGELSACLWRREGEALRIACEEHGSPPTSFEGALLLQRRAVHARRGLAALAGLWTGPSVFGGGTTLSIGADGSASLAELNGRVDEVTDEHLFLRVGGIDATCRYRATDDRLSLLCPPNGVPAPESFVTTVAPTVVFRRAARTNRAAPAVVFTQRVARSDADGDGVVSGADRCPEAPEDHDDFEDEDGCPDLDDDRDGTADADDACPRIPEDRDGVADGDGCPEG